MHTSITTNPPAEAWLYLPTEVTVQSEGNWTSAFKYCAEHSCELCVVTAWNPGSQRFGIKVNQIRNEQLLADLEILGLEVFEALGSDPKSDYSESSWAVLGLTDSEAIQLGSKYGQVAFFRISDARQRVIGCLERWEVSRANPTPIGMEKIADWVNSPLHRNLLIKHLNDYFGKTTGVEGFEGKNFEWFIHRADPGSFTSDDVLAIGALSVYIPANTARKLVEDAGSEYSVLLKKCTEFADENLSQSVSEWLWSEESPFLTLFDKLGLEAGVGKVIRSKLMAAKFPGLIPIRDSKIEKLLLWENEEDWWMPMHQLLQETKKTLSGLEVDSSIGPSLLRKLDVILWMEAVQRGL